MGGGEWVELCGGYGVGWVGRVWFWCGLLRSERRIVSMIADFFDDYLSVSGWCLSGVVVMRRRIFY